MRQSFRQKILSMTRKEVIGAVKRIVAKQMEEGKAVVFAGKDLLEKANLELAAAGMPPLLIENV